MRGSERFTQRASTAITKAHDAALGMGHSYVGTEHLPVSYTHLRAHET